MTSKELWRERFEKAARTSLSDLDGKIANLAVVAHWINGSDSFWFERTGPSGLERFMVDAPSGRIEPQSAENEFDAPFDPNVVPSPDGKLIAFVRAWNVWVRDATTGEERQLTKDGLYGSAYGVDSESTSTNLTRRRLGMPMQLAAVWSPDSRKLLTTRVEEANVGSGYLLESAPPRQARPVLHEYKLALPGDHEVPTYHPVVLDVETGEITKIDHPGLTAVRMHFAPTSMGCLFWGHDANTAYLVDITRGDRSATVHTVDVRSGAVRQLFSEETATFLDLGPDIYGEINAALVPGKPQLIWSSERSGFAHLYLYDLESGDLLGQLTDGEWVVREILHVDSESVYFFGSDREPGHLPCLRSLYRVKLDGTDLTRLTDEHVDVGAWQMNLIGRLMLGVKKPDSDLSGVSPVSPSGRYFVLNRNAQDHTPSTFLFDALERRVVAELATVDITATGVPLRWPVVTTVTAADGVTPLRALLFTPSDLDESKSYPVIDSIYSGPQTTIATSSLTDPMSSSRFPMAWGLAELGFAVVLIDGRGTSCRSKTFHDHAFGATGRGSDLADHVAGIRQLAERFPFMDGSRVGAIGTSAGGYGAARAVLAYPDDYHVAVADSGNHELALQNFGWSERYMGPFDADAYDRESNSALAANLRGKLLLIHGDMDEAVQPAHTMRLAAALFEADKDFDMLIVPSAAHGALARGTVLRRAWSYLVRHLHGAEPPTGIKVRAMMDLLDERTVVVRAVQDGAAPADR